MNNEVWTFNFSSNEWLYLGKHEPLDEFMKKVQYKKYLGADRIEPDYRN